MTRGHLWRRCRIPALLAPVFACSSAENPPEVVLLSSGPRVGVYHQIATGIRDVFESEFGPSELAVIPSEGSLENMARLTEGLTDWAIIQRDNAVQVYFQSTQPFRQFEILMPLFPEAVQIFVREQFADSATRNVPLNSFIELLRSGRIGRFGIGPTGSGSNQNLKNIFLLYGLSGSSNAFVEIAFEEAFEKFSNGELDALAITGAIPYRTLPFGGLNGVRLVTMDDRDLNRIVGHIENFDPITIQRETYPFVRENAQTVGTWALLVGHKRRDARRLEVLIDDRSLIGAIGNYASRLSALDPINRALTAARMNTTDTSDGTEGFDPPAEWYRQAFFRGLPISHDLEDTLSAAAPFNLFRELWVHLLITALVLAVVIGLALRYVRDLEIKKYWLRYKHYIYGFLFLGCLFYFIGYLILFLEQRFSSQYLVYSPIKDLSIGELRQWLLIFSLTGYNAGIFPISPLAQIATTAMVPSTWFGVGLAVVAEVIVSHRMARRKSGMQVIKYGEHVVICGWNERMPSLVTKAISAKDQMSGNRKTAHRFVLLDTRIREQLERLPEVRRLQERGELDIVYGEATDSEALSRANVDKADTIILVADERSKEADEKTLLRALAISRYCKEVANQTTLDNIYIIAEVSDDRFRKSLLESDVNEVVCSPALAENVLLQSAFNHGLSDFLHAILTYDTSNEFYLIHAKDYPFLLGMSFDEALRELRSNHVLLIAIKVIFTENGEEIIDRDAIERKLKAKNLTRQIIANPLHTEEDEHRIGEHDQLLVLASDEKTLHRSFSKRSRKTIRK